MSHADRPDPETVVLKNGDLAATPEELLNSLNQLGVEHQTIVHVPLYTVEQARSVQYADVGAHTKNLFLRNKKGRMFLLVVENDQQVDLRSLRDKLNVPGGQFAFASTERLGLYLGVVPGSVSPLAVYNDHDCAVQILLQNKLLNHEWIYLHPCRNTHSTRLRTDDLLKVLDSWKHPATILDLD
ncbi:MAG: prolyl-tRNA synthetase associated domain-containing protein [Granulosicoccus sp.]